MQQEKARIHALQEENEQLKNELLRRDHRLQVEVLESSNRLNHGETPNAMRNASAPQPIPNRGQSVFPTRTPNPDSDEILPVGSRRQRSESTPERSVRPRQAACLAPEPCPTPEPYLATSPTTAHSTPNSAFGRFDNSQFVGMEPRLVPVIDFGFKAEDLDTSWFNEKLAKMTHLTCQLRNGTLSQELPVREFVVRYSTDDFPYSPYGKKLVYATLPQQVYQQLLEKAKEALFEKHKKVGHDLDQSSSHEDEKVFQARVNHSAMVEIDGERRSMTDSLAVRRADLEGDALLQFRFSRKAETDKYVFQVVIVGMKVKEKE